MRMPGNRVLLVSQTDPWGDTSGARIRQRLVVDALAREHAIDLVVVSLSTQKLHSSAHPAVERAVNLLRPPPNLAIANRLRWFTQSSRPFALLSLDYRSVRRELADWLSGEYALTWVSRSSVYDAVAPVLPDAPIVVDLDDLEGAKLRTWLHTMLIDGQADVRRRLTSWPRVLWHTRNAQCWERLDRDIAKRVNTVLVCSELDRDRLRVPNARILPNGYPRPRNPVGRVHVSDSPTVVLQGDLTYGPNVDGAAFFVREVLPTVRRNISDIRVRLVGRASDQIRRLHKPPGVTVTGFVPDMASELSHADLIVVPVRFGGGTRIKVLEAWAHRIPVVSTSFGVEGLNGSHGLHFLASDDPLAMAVHCVRALRDETLRQQLVTHAHALFLQRYDKESVTAEAVNLVEETKRVGRTP